GPSKPEISDGAAYLPHFSESLSRVNATASCGLCGQNVINGIEAKISSPLCRQANWVLLTRSQRRQSQTPCNTRKNN
ncbi:MAG: hypothetical protein VW709_17555, partial [Rickettsiales bacterium]